MSLSLVDDDPPQSTLVIGISGCSSSGKTTLARNLAMVLTSELSGSSPTPPVHLPSADDGTPAAQDNDLQPPGPSRAADVGVFHLDAYFRLPASDDGAAPPLPKAFFYPVFGPDNVVCNLRVPGRGAPQPQPQPEGEGEGRQRGEKSKGKSAAVRRLVPWGVVEAEDRDCVEAVDFDAALRDLDGWLRGGVREGEGCALMPAPEPAVEQQQPPTFVHDAARAFHKRLEDIAAEIWRGDDDDDDDRGGLGKYIRRRTRATCGGPQKPLLACRVAIVEGFLLGARTKASAETPAERCGGGDSDGRERMEVVDQEADAEPPSQKQQQQQQQERRRRPTTAAAEELFERVEVSMFLHVDRATAKRRRFARPDYIDWPAGNRRPGQWWRSEGYFDGVAWPRYVGYFGAKIAETVDEAPTAVDGGGEGGGGAGWWQQKGAGVERRRADEVAPGSGNSYLTEEETLVWALNSLCQHIKNVEERREGKQKQSGV